MTTTVPQSAADASGNPRDAHSEAAAVPRHYRHWSDAAWNQLNIKPGLAHRMARIDRALQAIGAISEILAAQKASQDDPDEMLQHLLTDNQENGLQAAALSIWVDATDAMTELRDNSHDLWSKGGPR